MSEKPKLTEAIPSFVVEDVVKTAEYYRDSLGFEILGYFWEDPPVFAIVRRDSAEFHFGKVDEGKEMKVNTDIRRGIGHDAYILTNDIQALFEEFSEKGVDIVEGPIKRVYNCIEVIVRDCNGFQLIFAQSS
jgi:catechol 2,3-dioxygenase-like lactoylglutathione lyase family enzyme